MSSRSSPARKSRVSWRQARCQRDAVRSAWGVSMAGHYTACEKRVFPRATPSCAIRQAACGPARRGTRRRSLHRLLVLRLVLRDVLLQVGVLLARQTAQLVERREVLAGLRQVVDLQVGLAAVFVGAAMLGVVEQGFFVVL